MSKTKIPKGWRQVQLGDVVEVNRALWNPAGGSQIMYLDLTAVIAPGVLSAPKEIAASDAPSRARRQIHSGDILVSTVRPNLRGFARVRKAPDNLVASTGFAVLAPKTDVDGSFIYHHVMTQPFAAELENATTGQAYPAVRPVDVASYELPLPPLREQRAIAAVLDAIDDAIERTDAVIAATEQLRDSLLDELLTRGLPGWHSEWKGVPGLGMIPVDWEAVRLGEVAEVQTGRAVNRKVPTRHAVNVPYLSVANVKDGYLDLRTVKKMQVDQSEVDRYSLRAGDVLFTEGGDADKLGRGTVWQGEIPFCLHQNHIFAVRPDLRFLRAEFLSFYATSGFGKRYFLGAAKQTTNLASMNSTQLKQMPLPLPTIQEQDQLVVFLSAVGDLIQQVSNERESLKSLKDSTADALLAGRLRVTDAQE